MDEVSGDLGNIVRPVNLILTGGPHRSTSESLLDRGRSEILDAREKTPAVDLFLQEHPDALDVFSYTEPSGKVVYRKPHLPADLQKLQKHGQLLLQACAQLPEVNSAIEDGQDSNWLDVLHPFLRRAFASYDLRPGVGAWQDPVSREIHKLNFPDVGSLNQLVVFVINEFVFRTNKAPAYVIGTCPQCVRLFIKPRTGTDYCHPYCRTVWGKNKFNHEHMQAGGVRHRRAA